jgi:hypothetical protein
MDPIATTVNDLGEPDAGKPPVRFDEGRFNKPSTLHLRALVIKPRY